MKIFRASKNLTDEQKELIARLDKEMEVLKNNKVTIEVAINYTTGVFSDIYVKMMEMIKERLSKGEEYIKPSDAKEMLSPLMVLEDAYMHLKAAPEMKMFWDMLEHVREVEKKEGN